MSLPDCTDLGDGVLCIDTGIVRPRLAACYLLMAGNEAAFIDTGVGAGVDDLLSLLEFLGLEREQIRYVMPTHVHLDHAGGAGQLMAVLPQARLLVHPRGAPHMCDPGRLEAGARAVYGDETFDRMFGGLVAVPPDRIMESTDEQVLQLGTRSLRILHTPGHARHHYCVFDELAGVLFAGDTFGVAYPDLSINGRDFIFPPTTPVHFDPPAWIESVRRLAQLKPRRACLTHFGAVTAIDQLARELVEGIEMHAEAALDCGPGKVDEIEQKLSTAMRDVLARRTLELRDEEWRYLMEMDLRLNARGLDVWLTRSASLRPSAMAGRGAGE